MNKLVFPWPEKWLFPNVKCHWAVEWRAKKKYRAQCAEIAQDYILPGQDRYKLYVTFHTKTKRRPDKDNCNAAMKAGYDGVADALGVDDSRFDFGPPEYGKPVKGGAVVIEIK